MPRRMRREIYRGRIVDLGIERVTLPNGKDVELEVIRHQGASAVAAVDDQGRVALIRQFRHAAGGYIWELPAGVLDKPDEAPAACAGRELLEETGLHAERLTHLATILTTPGFTDERIDLFQAQADPTGEGPTEAGTYPVVVAFDEAVRMALAGEIEDAKSVVSLLLARERRHG